MENQESLNLNDLKLMAQIIKVVSTRGAIQAEEMAAVGILYTKLLNFVKAAQPEETAAAETAAALAEAIEAAAQSTAEGN
jgi:hypothetical protein